MTLDFCKFKRTVEVLPIVIELSEDCINTWLEYRKSSRQEVIDCWIEDKREISRLRFKEGEESFEELEAGQRKQLTEYLWFLL